MAASASAGDPQYARNDGGDATIAFGAQLWAGTLHNSGSAGPGIPTFPRSDDVVTTGAATLVGPTVAASGWTDALAMFALATGSPAIGAGDPLPAVPRDMLGAVRSSTAPTIGAIEGD